MSQTNMRLEEETKARIAELAGKWSPVKPLTATDVVRECVKRVYQQEAEGRKRAVRHAEVSETRTRSRKGQ